MSRSLKYFIDAEFMERPGMIDLLSLGVACEDGRKLYLVNADADLSKANDWVKRNVLPRLFSPGTDPASVTRPHARIGREVREFVSAGGRPPEFWGWYADYDWVVFAWTYGTMMDLPDEYPRFCRDLRQWIDDAGVPRSALPLEPEDEHNALADAVWTLEAWRKSLRWLSDRMPMDEVP